MFHLIHQPVILADIGEVIGAVVTLGALVLWIIQKIAEANKAVRPRQPQQAPRPAAPLAQGGGAPAMGQQADPLRNQVEEFLRRANQANQPRHPAGSPRKAVPPAREIELLVDDEASQPQRRVVGAPLQRMQTRPVEKRPSQPSGDKRPERRSVIPRKRVTLAEKADERAAARSKSIDRQVSNLGKRIITEDEQFDVQLKAKFDHKIGTLAGSTVPETELVPIVRETPASQIAAMLANPDGVRQAMILNEVLRRPTDRW